MPKQNNYVTKDYFDEKMNQVDEKFNQMDKKADQVIEKLDWLMGKYKAHDEEHILLTNRVSEHTDQLEVINAKLRIQI